RGHRDSPVIWAKSEAEDASSVDDYFCRAYVPAGGRARQAPSAWSWTASKLRRSSTMASSQNNRTAQLLPRDAREGIEAVFDAVSKWRDELGASTERYSETVLDKMADAAEALGWPKELVDASHKQLVQVSKAQMHTIDQLMDAWKKQLTAPAADMAQLRAFPG